VVDERILERRRKVRSEQRHRRLRRTMILIMLAGLLLVGVLVERSSLVALDEVRVVGTNRLSADEVRQAAGLRLGTSTLRLRLGPAQARVEAMPLVESAMVRRVDPLTVEVAVTEREPVMMVLAGRRAVLVDATGVLLQEGREEGLLAVELPGPTPLPPLGQRAARDTALGNVVAFHSQLPGPLRSEIVSYRASSPEDLEAQLVQGIRVLLGQAVRIDEKARALGAVLEDLGAEPVSVIDVRAPGAPVVIP
jgi:cell division protein FtsQ